MGGLFGGKSVNTSDPIIASLRINTSASGKAIALVYGTTRIAGNLIWYGDFTAIAQKESQGGGKGGGGKQTHTSYTYTAAALMGLCEGEIIDVLSLWADKNHYEMLYHPEQVFATSYAFNVPYPPIVSVPYSGDWWGDLGAAYLSGEYAEPLTKVASFDMGAGGENSRREYINNGDNVYQFSTWVVDSFVEVYYQYHYDAWWESALDQVSLTLYRGTTTQTPFTHLLVNHPSEALAYRRLAYVATSKYDLGDSGSMPNHTFEVRALLPYSGTGDAIPSAVFADYLTDAYHGAGFTSDKIGDLTAWEMYCRASGLFISPAYTEQEQASEALKRLLQCGNAAAVYSEGIIKVIPYGDASSIGNGADYVPNNTPVYALTDDDFLGDGDSDPITVSRGNPADAYNQVQVNYYNRDNGYNDDIAEAKDQSNIEIYGLRPMSPVDLKEICDPNVARAIAQLILQRALYIRNTYNFKLSWKYCLLEPMDIVTLTEGSGTGLINQPVRIISIEENDDGTLGIEAEDYIGGVTSYVAYPSQVSSGYKPSYNATASRSAEPIIFDAPTRLTVSGYEVWIAAAGAGDNWGGGDCPCLYRRGDIQIHRDN